MLGRDAGGAMSPMKSRFRGYAPVVVDLETGGFDKKVHAVLQIAAVSLCWVEGRLAIDAQRLWQVEPHPDTEVEAASLQLTGIDLGDPDRGAVPEGEAVREMFRFVRGAVRGGGCKRAVLTAHNAHFDHGFVMAAAARNRVGRNPFHPFTVLDTASLAAVAYGHTVLSEACARAGLPFEGERAHSASYDAEKTARLFCGIVNAWDATLAPECLRGVADVS